MKKNMIIGNASQGKTAALAFFAEQNKDIKSLFVHDYFVKPTIKVRGVYAPIS
jgi:hypothetical protein